MRRTLFVLFLCSMVFFIFDKSSYARSVSYDDSDMIIIVNPLTKTHWNYAGVVPKLPVELGRHI